MGGDPVEKCTLTFEIAGQDGEPIVADTMAEAAGWQVMLEDALIARALRVATDEELAEAGLVRLVSAARAQENGGAS